MINARQAAGGSGVLLLRYPGRRDRRRRPSQSAFIHRNMRSSVQILSYYGGPSGLAGARSFVASAAPRAGPIATGQAYQNYPDADMTTWRQAYYGNQYSDLVSFKRERDPKTSCRSRRRSGRNANAQAPRPTERGLARAARV